METSVRLKIGPSVLELVSEDWILSKLEHLFKKYIVDDAPDAVVSVKVDRNLKRMDYEDLSELYFISRIKNSNLITECPFINASFDFMNKKGIAFFPGESAVTREIDLFSLRGILMYIQIIFSILLLEKDCLLIHASGIVHNGKGHIFAGHNEAGKTTIATKAGKEGMKILGDDCVCVDAKNKKLFSTFFKSDFDTFSADFASCSFIIQDKKFSKKRISSEEGLHALMKNNHLFLYLRRDAKPFIGKLIKLSSLVAKEIPMYSLKSRLEDEIWVMI